MPELAEIAGLETERRRTDDEARDARIAVDDLTAEQARADGDVEQVRARQRRDQERLDSGAVGNPKDLERISAELVSLARRISTLEDQELEVMERLEEAQGRLDGAQERLAAIDHRLADLVAARDAAAAEIDADLVALEAERGPVASRSPRTSPRCTSACGPARTAWAPLRSVPGPARAAGSRSTRPSSA